MKDRYLLGKLKVLQLEEKWAGILTGLADSSVGGIWKVTNKKWPLGGQVRNGILLKGYRETDSLFIFAFFTCLLIEGGD